MTLAQPESSPYRDPPETVEKRKITVYIHNKEPVTFFCDSWSNGEKEGLILYKTVSSDKRRVVAIFKNYDYFTSEVIGAFVD